MDTKVRDAIRYLKTLPLEERVKLIVDLNSKVEVQELIVIAHLATRKWLLNYAIPEVQL